MRLDIDKLIIAVFPVWSGLKQQQEMQICFFLLSENITEKCFIQFYEFTVTLCYCYIQPADKAGQKLDSSTPLFNTWLFFVGVWMNGKISKS